MPWRRTANRSRAGEGMRRRVQQESAIFTRASKSCRLSQINLLFKNKFAPNQVPPPPPHGHPQIPSKSLGPNPGGERISVVKTPPLPRQSPRFRPPPPPPFFSVN